jgi:Fe-S cluster biogenesis protein NfuA
MGPDDGTTKEQVEAVVNRLRPAIRMDGGDIDLVGVVDGLVTVRLRGRCASCASTMMTLRLGIERAIRAEVPQVTGVEAVGEQKK